MSHGFRLNLNLEMPTERPNRVELCDVCHMKHTDEDDCWEGMLPAGMLPLPELTKALTGREMIDNGMKKEEEEEHGA